MTHRRLTLIALAAAVISAASARAEVKKFMNTCDGKLCPSYRLVLTPPPGWHVDEDATREYNVQFLAPDGKDFATAPALIYVQVFFHRDKQQSLADFARVSNARWQQAVKDAKLHDMPAVARANGKPGFLRFGFENPHKPQQNYEIGAMGVDSDADGNEYVLDIVITGKEKAAVERAEKDCIAFLKAH
jgi:hypothetical protein